MSADDCCAVQAGDGDLGAVAVNEFDWYFTAFVAWHTAAMALALLIYGEGGSPGNDQMLSPSSVARIIGNSLIFAALGPAWWQWGLAAVGLVILCLCDPLLRTGGAMTAEQGGEG